MRITGLPYRIVSHLGEGGNVRSYLHDPSRATDAERYAAGFQPTAKMIAAMHDILDGNPLWLSMVSHARDMGAPTARLELRWPGNTPGVRAFTFVPSVSTPGPRTVYMTCAEDGRPCRVRSADPLYSLLSWPLLFPKGRAPRRRPTGPVSTWPPPSERAPLETLTTDGWDTLRGLELSRTTLAIACQPERRNPTNDEVQAWNLRWRAQHVGEPPRMANPFVLVPTLSPYDTDGFPRDRRTFSRVELAGRCGEEYVLDRWLCRADQRRWQLMALQKRLRGMTMSPAERAEIQQLEDYEEHVAWLEDRPMGRSSFIPDSERGSPTHHKTQASRALFVMHKTRRPLVFVTKTLNASCQEIRTRLARFPNGPGAWTAQETHDRVGLHCDVFEGKRLALEAALRSGTIFRNIGRPVFDKRVRVQRADGKGWVAVDKYRYPLETRDGGHALRGHLAASRENQRNGFEHMHYTVAPSDCPPVRRSSYPSRVAALSLRAPPLTASSHRLLSTRTPTHAVWQHWTVRVAEGDRIDWADELTCARIPDRSVLLQFKMLLPRGEARALAGVERRRGCGAVHAAYAYLDVPADGDAEPNMADLVVHPDIVHDGGAEFVNPNRLLLELITIVAAEGYELEKCRVRVDGARNVADGTCGLVDARCAPPPDSPEASDPAQIAACSQAGEMYFSVLLDGHDAPVVLPRVCLTWVEGGAAPSHYSLRPYSNLRPKGKLIHGHLKGPTFAEKHCTKKTWRCDDGEWTLDPCCDAYFPKPISPFTCMGAGGFICYRRGPADVMVVAYNPWFLFQDGCHCNVEVVCGGVNALLYMFKLIRYIHKPHETNQAQVVRDGEEMHGAPDPDTTTSTHRREDRPSDGVKEWFKVMETCAPYAYAGHAQRALFVLEPDCVDIRCAAPPPHGTIRELGSATPISNHPSVFCASHLWQLTSAARCRRLLNCEGGERAQHG